MKPPSLSSLIAVVAAGLVCGLICIVLAISNATLLARGPLGGHLPAIIGVTLLAGAILPIVTAMLSGIRGQVTTTQEISVVALGTVITAVAAASASDPASSGFLLTVVVAIGASTALSGLAMLALGIARLGRIVRFVPYPVFGGFLAITGWYLLIGGADTVLRHPIELQHIDALADTTALAKLGAAAAFVIAVRVLADRFPPGVLLPLAVIVSIILFNAVVAIAGIDADILRSSGWIISTPPGGLGMPHLDAASLRAIDWGAVATSLIYAPVVILVTVAGAMMNASGLELALKSDIDINRELKSTGWGNLFAGMSGGMAGFPSLGGTLAGINVAGPRRTVGIISGVVTFAALIAAPQLLPTVPSPLLGALLIGAGISLLHEWAIVPLRTLPRSEYGVILLILVVSILAGVPAGILTGVGAALVVFVVTYSRVDGIRFLTTGDQFESRQLAEVDRKRLADRRASILVMKLTGFLFFGTADRLVLRIRGAVEASTAPIAFAIIDFQRVSGMDSSAMLSFARLERFANQRGMRIVLSGLSDDTRARFAAFGLALGQGGAFTAEPELDDAIHCAERALLDSDSVPDAAISDPTSILLGSAILAVAILPYLDRLVFPAGTRILTQAEQSDEMYFIEAGTGVVHLERQGGRPVRLSSFGPADMIGELAFYRQQPRTASVVATTDITAWRLTREDLLRIEAEQPELAAHFHHAVAAHLAERLQKANGLIQVLAD